MRPKLSAIIPQFEPTFDEREYSAVRRVLRSGWLNEGLETQLFEKEFAGYVGAKYAVAVPNGSIALFLALKALDISTSDEVLVPDLTFIADAQAVRMCHAWPILVDVDNFGNIDPQDISTSRTPRTKAIIAVNLNGRFCNPEVFEDHVPIIEDCAQSLASWHEGSRSDMQCYSFAPSKHLTTGQGGMITTNFYDHYEKVKRLKDHGRFRKVGELKDSYDHEGLNFKFTDLQAAIGRVQLAKLKYKMIRLNNIWKHYRVNLADVVDFPPSNSRWYVDCFLDDWSPDSIGKKLLKKGIGTRLQYLPLHLQPLLYRTEYEQHHWNANDHYKRTLFLPSSTSLSDHQISFVCEELEGVVHGHSNE